MYHYNFIVQGFLFDKISKQLTSAMGGSGQPSVFLAAMSSSRSDEVTQFVR
jgi:hypothetical protein